MMYFFEDVLTSSLGSAFPLWFPLNLLSATEEATRRATTRNLPAAILIWWPADFLQISCLFWWPAGVTTSTAPLPLTSAPVDDAF